MLADFFRMLFHKVDKGMYYTASMKDEVREKTFHLVYVAQGAAPGKEERYPLDVLAAGDVLESTLAQVKKMVEERPVKTVIFPEECPQELVDWCQEKHTEVIIAKDTYTIAENRWEFRFQAFQGNSGSTLVMYQGFTGDDLQKEDCAFVTKIVSQEPCVSCIYGEDDYCGFGCNRLKDYDVIGGHKKSKNGAYRMGTLVLGDMLLKGQTDKLSQMIEGVEEKIRCVYLPSELKRDNYEGFLEDICNKRDYVYVIGNQSQTEPEIVGKILSESPYVQYRSINEDTGFCASGYRIPYLREKGC